MREPRKHRERTRKKNDGEYSLPPESKAQSHKKLDVSPTDAARDQRGKNQGDTCDDSPRNGSAE